MLIKTLFTIAEIWISHICMDKEKHDTHNTVLFRCTEDTHVFSRVVGLLITLEINQTQKHKYYVWFLWFLGKHFADYTPIPF